MRKYTNLRSPRFPLLASCVALVTVWGCSEIGESPLTPDLDPAPQFSQENGGGVPDGFVPNGVPYRNPAFKDATGRSGGASVTARAMLNQDGSTDLEVTTGDFDGTAPENDMTKLQVKLLDDEDDATWTDNQNRIRSGFVHSIYDDVIRHDRLQVQASVNVPNASGKGRRTGVVTIAARANLRPDLAATSVEGPAEAFVGTSAVFTGYISEINTDLAATTDCVFYVNGDVSAGAEGVWVGEGDEVTCIMEYLFDEIGTYTIDFAAENVTPGDYDLSNNSTSTTIEIVNPIHQFQGSAWANERHYRYRYDRSFYSGANYYDYYTNNERHETRASFYGYTVVVQAESDFRGKRRSETMA